jgi:4-amino-4-deoxy-L-arabinose transferase-like glycosyltransferase
MFPALREHRKPLLVLGALCALLFAFKLGAYGLLDPDEPFYALTAKEMLSAHNWLVPTIFDQPQFEKPILFYWLEMASFKAFGLHEWAARLAPCLAGFAAVFATYAWAQVLFRDKKTSFLSALVLATAAQYAVCARVVLTDMVFTFFVVATWLSFSMKREYWGFFFSALGALTKGPLGFMIPFMGIITKKDKRRFRGVWVFFLVAAPWYAYMTWRFGGDFLYQFFIHENVRRFFIAEHKGLDRIFLYPLGFMGGFFPWSVFIPASLIYGLRQAARGRSRAQRAFLFLSLSFWLPFFFFTAAKSKLLSYTFPLYPVLAVLVGAWAARFARATSFTKTKSRTCLPLPYTKIGSFLRSFCAKIAITPASPCGSCRGP